MLVGWGWIVYVRALRRIYLYNSLLLTDPIVLRNSLSISYHGLVMVPAQVLSLIFQDSSDRGGQNDALGEWPTANTAHRLEPYFLLLERGPWSVRCTSSIVGLCDRSGTQQDSSTLRISSDNPLTAGSAPKRNGGVPLRIRMHNGPSPATPRCGSILTRT